MSGSYKSVFFIGPKEGPWKVGLVTFSREQAELMVERGYPVKVRDMADPLVLSDAH